MIAGLLLHCRQSQNYPVSQFPSVCQPGLLLARAPSSAHGFVRGWHTELSAWLAGAILDAGARFAGLGKGSSNL